MLPKICSIPECGNKHLARGMCTKHYQRWRALVVPPTTAKCSIPECENILRSRGWCEVHYKRHYKHGDPLVNLNDVTPSERFWPKVKKSDGCWEWIAHVEDDGYGSFFYDGRTRGAHRVSYLLNVGPIPEGMEIDHICRNRSCVRPSHLRAATPKQNNENRPGFSSNKSKVRGVSWHEKSKKWRVRVTHNYKIIQVGMFLDLTEAEAAAIAKRNELYTHNDIDRIAA